MELLSFLFWGEFYFDYKILFIKLLDCIFDVLGIVLNMFRIICLNLFFSFGFFKKLKRFSSLRTKLK